MIEYEIHPEMEVIAMMFQGDVDFEEVIEVHVALLADPRFRKRYKGIADQRRANMQLSPEEIEKVAEFNRTHGMIEARWALLIDAPVASALAMIYGEETADLHEMAIFVTEEAASDYLGLDVAPLLRGM